MYLQQYHDWQSGKDEKNLRNYRRENVAEIRVFKTATQNYTDERDERKTRVQRGLRYLQKNKQ